MCEREVKRKGEGRGKEGGQAGRCTQELDTSVQDTPPPQLFCADTFDFLSTE